MLVHNVYIQQTNHTKQHKQTKETLGKAAMVNIHPKNMQSNDFNALLSLSRKAAGN